MTSAFVKILYLEILILYNYALAQYQGKSLIIDSEFDLCLISFVLEKQTLM